jgi:hypothetical protein
VAPLQDRQQERDGLTAHTFESRSRHRRRRSHRGLARPSMPAATVSLAQSSFPPFRVQLLVSGAAKTDPYLGHDLNASQNG